VRRIRGLPHPDVRRAAWAQSLCGADPESVAMLLGYLARHVAEEDVRAAWLDAALALVGPVPSLDPEGLGAAEARLESHPLRPVFAFLGVPPAERRGAEVTGESYVFADVPLGLRKARARGRSPDVLRQMCGDPDPSVVEILLGNPLAGEGEALRVAARRPQTAATFGVVLSSPRFGVREPVQAALALNPWCPVRLALVALPLLSWAHLEDVAAATALDPRVRAAAASVRGL
jgi:hypothetical protein